MSDAEVLSLRNDQSEEDESPLAILAELYPDHVRLTERNGEDAVVVVLREPLEFAKNRWETLTLVAPRGKHYKAMDRVKGDNARMLALVAAIAGIRPPEVLDDISTRDLKTITAALAALEGNDPRAAV